MFKKLYRQRPVGVVFLYWTDNAGTWRKDSLYEEEEEVVEAGSEEGSRKGPRKKARKKGKAVIREEICVCLSGTREPQFATGFCEQRTLDQRLILTAGDSSTFYRTFYIPEQEGLIGMYLNYIFQVDLNYQPLVSFLYCTISEQPGESLIMFI